MTDHDWRWSQRASRVAKRLRACAMTRGSAASVQIAQSTARRHAQDVMRSMTDMGVPATRLNVASTTDPSATSSEVRVFVR